MNHSVKLPAHRKLARLLGLCWLAYSASAVAQAPSPSDKLAAIRHELVQAALEAPTQVQVTQWIDDQGVLRESSSFRSGMKIRGVRVLSYEKNPEGELSAKLDWETPVPSKAALATAQASTNQQSKNCKRAEAGHLVHVAALNWDLGPQWNVDELRLLMDLRAQFRSDWERSNPHTTIWRLSEPKAEVQRSSYNQALLASGADDIPWQITISVTSVTKSKMTEQFEAYQKFMGEIVSPVFESNPPLKLQLHMTLGTRLQSRPVLQLTAPIELQTDLNNLEATRLNSASKQRVFQQAQSWAKEIQETLSCLPVVAQVTQAAPSEFRINAGAASGVRVGDEWLLADEYKIPQRLLEANSTQSSVLATVQLVDQHHALLRVQAGAANNVQRNWVAWAVEKTVNPTRGAAP